MHDVRRLGLLAAVFFIALRVSVGWQFLYEGLWKYNSLSTTTPWSAEGYLKNAQGPFREHFYQIAGGSPFDLEWLDYDTVATRWDRWLLRFQQHYPKLDDRQKARLNQLLNGSKQYTAQLSALPDGVDLSRLKKSISWDAANQRLVVDGKWHLTPVERETLYRMVPDVRDVGGKLVGGTELEREFRDAVGKVYARQSRLGYKEKLAASLRGDSDRVGAIFQDVRKLEKAGIDPWEDFGDFKTYGEIDKYRAMVEEYEAELAAQETSFDQDHLAYQLDEIRKLRSRLVNPVKALEGEMKLTARDLLRPEQLAAGPVPPELNSLTISNYLTIAGLITLGLLLIAGLFTRTAAFLGAAMLLSFYLVSPPWPGVPPAPGPEHSLIVNKNLIEVIALLAIGFSASGRWFGLDAVISGVLRRRRTKAPANVRPGKGPIPIQPVS